MNFEKGGRAERRNGGRGGKKADFEEKGLLGHNFTHPLLPERLIDGRGRSLLLPPPEFLWEFQLRFPFCIPKWQEQTPTTAIAPYGAG